MPFTIYMTDSYLLSVIIESNMFENVFSFINLVVVAVVVVNVLDHE